MPRNFSKISADIVDDEKDYFGCCIDLITGREVPAFVFVKNRQLLATYIDQLAEKHINETRRNTLVE